MGHSNSLDEDMERKAFTVHQTLHKSLTSVRDLKEIMVERFFKDDDKEEYKVWNHLYIKLKAIKIFNNHTLK